MEHKDRRKLIDNLVVLTKELKLCPVLTYLQAKQIINLDHVETIRFHVINFFVISKF